MPATCVLPASYFLAGTSWPSATAAIGPSLSTAASIGHGDQVAGRSHVDLHDVGVVVGCAGGSVDTIQGLRCICLVRGIRGDSTMRFRATPTQHQEFRAAIRSNAEEAGVPVIHYDVLAWDMAHCAWCARPASMMHGR